MNGNYTFNPRGNVAQSTKSLGIGEWLLRIAEEDRARLGFPFFGKNMTIDNGLTEIRVTALEDGNSIIDITSSVPEEEEKPQASYRRRLLHCRVEITLADEDALIYEKDPSFVAVEPIASYDDEDRKIYLHTTYQIEEKRGIVVEGLNGDLNQNAVDDVKDVTRGDSGRKLSLDDAQLLIEGATGYKRVDKVMIGDEIAPIFTPSEKLRPSTAVSGTTEFNQLLRSSFWPQTTNPYKALDGYIYAAETATGGTDRWISTNEYRLDEPVETFDTEEMVKDETEKIHAISDTGSYYDSVEDPITETNIHPYGNINDEHLRYCYGLHNNFGYPFNQIIADFTPRVGDKVYIGDLGIAATRNKTFWLVETSEDGSTRNIYPDAKLLLSFIPYYVEMKNSSDIWLAHRYLTQTGDWYAVDYASNGHDADEIMHHIFPSVSYPIEPDVFHYTNFACNWLLHPFRNNSWGEYLTDFYTTARVNAELAANPQFCFNDYFVNASSIFCDAPNRLVLCIRNFFANSEIELPSGEIILPTQFAGKRRSYDIKFESTSDGAGGFYQDVDHFVALDTYDEVDTETSVPLTTENCPQFMTVKGDLVLVNLLSSIYAVCDYPEVIPSRLTCSSRWLDLEEDRTGVIPSLAGSTAGVQPDVITKRAWPTFLDGDWEYTNIYGAGITVESLGYARNMYELFTNPPYLKSGLNSLRLEEQLGRTLNGESIYSDGDEDISARIVVEATEKTWREEDTPESHLIHCIYRALERVGIHKHTYDKHHPVCNIRLEADLYDKYIDYGETL